MPDFGQRATDFGVQTGAGMAAQRLLGRNIPLPDFYNPNSQHPFADSQFNRMIHGDRAALRAYSRRVARSGINAGAAAATGGLSGLYQLGTGLWNLVMPDRLDIPSRYTSIGNMILPDEPKGTVTVGNINDTSGLGYKIDPWTGAPMPDFSEYGPYSSGYKYPNQQDYDSAPTLPDFSNYGNDLASGGGGYLGGGDMGGMGGGNAYSLGDPLAGGGWSNVMNGASPGMMADFAAPTNGDWMQRINVSSAGHGAITHGANRR